MNPFKSLFRSRDKPIEDRVIGNSYGFFLGQTTSGKQVTQRNAMQVSAVYACVRVIAEAVAQLPLHVYKINGDGMEKATDHPLYFLLHSEPNPEQTSFVYRETALTHLLLWGNSYSQIIRNGKNEVIALYPLMPDRMTVNRDDNGQIYYEYITYLYVYSSKEKRRNQAYQTIRIELYRSIRFSFTVMTLLRCPSLSAVCTSQFPILYWSGPCPSCILFVFFHSCAWMDGSH